MLDIVLFMLTNVVAFAVIIYLNHVRKRLYRLTVYQDEVRGMMNSYGLVFVVVFIFWFVGWNLAEGSSIGGLGIVLFLAFALVSVLVSVKARRLDDYSPARRDMLKR